MRQNPGAEVLKVRFAFNNGFSESLEQLRSLIRVEKREREWLNDYNRSDTMIRITG
jgi:hypothetical protein